MFALESRRYLTLRQNWAHSCRASRVAWVGLKTKIQTNYRPHLVDTPATPKIK